MKRLLFMVEGNPEELSNFSGIPHFFTRALLKCLTAIKIEVEVIETSNLFNVEELLLCLDGLKQGKVISELMLDADPSTRHKKLSFQLNAQLLREAQKTDASSYASVLKQYYARIAEYMDRRLSELLRPGDLILSQNHFYPYIGEGWPVYYFLDISLVDFYFNEKFGTVQGKKHKKMIEAMYRDMERAVLTTAQGILCFSQALKDDLYKSYYIPKKCLTVVGAGVNLESYPEPIFRQPSALFHLLFVGLDFERKGGRVLFEAMEMLRDEPVDLTVVTRTEQVTNISVPRNVIMFPPCDKSNLDALYRSADAFVFPTLFEPFGIVVCEAMSYSLPVISTHIFAIPEILDTNESFLLIEPNNAHSLAAAIRHLMKNPDIRLKIGKHNYLRSQRTFQWSNVANKIASRCLSDSISVGVIGT